MLAFPSLKGRDANQITSFPFTPDSAGHVHTSLSWRDYADKNNHPVCLLYSAIHLRLGIEHLWFEIFQASSGNDISESDYNKAVKEATKLYKLIDSRTPHYVSFIKFSQLIAFMDSRPHPPTIVWDMSRLKKIHGELSSNILHFQGDSSHGAFSHEWIVEQNSFIKNEGGWIYDEMRSRGNLPLFKPERLTPSVRDIWEDFKNGKIDEESVRIRLRLVQPL